MNIKSPFIKDFSIWTLSSDGKNFVPDNNFFFSGCTVQSAQIMFEAAKVKP